MHASELAVVCGILLEKPVIFVFINAKVVLCTVWWKQPSKTEDRLLLFSYVKQHGVCGSGMDYGWCTCSV